MLKIFFYISFTLLLPLSGFAEIIIEPHLGYANLKESGSVTVGGLKADLDEQSAKGFIPGLRLGVTWGKIALGLDYNTVELDQDGKNYRMSNLGGFIMGKFKKIRIWGGYIFSSKYDSSVEIQDINNNIFIEEGIIEGTGPKIGFGYHLAKHFSLNLEWMSLTYNKENFSLLDSVDIKSSGLLLSLGFPFAF